METKDRSTANLAEEGQIQWISFLTEVVCTVVGDVYSTCTAKSCLCKRIQWELLQEVIKEISRSDPTEVLFVVDLQQHRILTAELLQICHPESRIVANNFPIESRSQVSLVIELFQDRVVPRAIEQFYPSLKSEPETLGKGCSTDDKNSAPLPAPRPVFPDSSCYQGGRKHYAGTHQIFGYQAYDR